MADRTSIEWTDATWNTVGGCARVHDGCRNCYAEIMAARFSKPGQWGEGLAKIVTLPDGSKDHRWTGEIRFNAKALTQPLRWTKPRRIFVNSTADTFHDGVTDDQLDQIFAVMALCPQHTFQVLTKRPERAARYLTSRSQPDDRGNPADDIRVNLTAWTQTPSWRARYPKTAKMIPTGKYCANIQWPLPNVWIGTSISDQASADAMIPHLLATPAAVRFVSAEPLLGPVSLCVTASDGRDISALIGVWSGGPEDDPDDFEEVCGRTGKIDLVIVGGESGPGARPMHPDWARSLRDQCNAAGVAFFFKQWGEWGPGSYNMATGQAVFRAFPNFQTWVNKASTWVNGGACFDAQGRRCKVGADFMRARDEGTFPVTIIHHVGKKAAGRTLDGREWNEMPEVPHA